MEFLFIIGFVLYLIVKFSASDQNINTVTTPGTTAYQNANSLTMSLKREKVKDFDCISIYVNGKFTIANRNISHIVDLIEMDQLTAGNSREPVICVIKEFTSGDTPVFHHITKPQAVDAPSVVGWERESRVMAIPIDSLKFATSGDIRIEIGLKIMGHNRLNNQFEQIKSLTRTISIFSSSPGYKEVIDSMNSFQEGAVELAAILIGIDGEINQEEKQQVYSWIKDNGSSSKQSELKTLFDQSLKKNLNLKDALTRAKAIIQGLKEKIEPSDRMSLLGLLHQISIADGQHGVNEFKIIKYLMKEFDIDPLKYSDMLSKSMDLESEQVEDVNYDTLLGIDGRMGKERQREILKEQYKEWNKKVNSSNRVEAKNAENILKYIAKKRAELDY